MPFISHDRLKSLEADNAQLGATVSHFQEMAAHLALAVELRSEISRVIHEHPELPGSQIGELAYRLVLDRQVEQARDEVVAQYEQTHRRNLYAKVVAEVEAEEGAHISEEVREKIESNPAVALDLRESARRELAARAMGIVRDEVTAEQEEVIAKETDRQILLDRFDVEFALNCRLKLVRDDLLEVLHPDDKLKMYFESPRNPRQGCLTLDWKVDALGNAGWLFGNTTVPLYAANNEQVQPNKGKFVNPVNLNRNLESGIEVPEINVITSSFPLAIAQRNTKGDSKTRSLFLSYGSQHPVVISGIDFQTKNLYFYNGTQTQTS